MATGDDAAAGGMELVSSSAGKVKDGATEITKTRDYVANGPTHWKPGVTLPASKIGGGAVPIANGGTGATTAAAARTALGIIAANVPTSGGASNVQADQDFIVVQLGNRVQKTGDTMSGDLFIPGASPANMATWTVAYFNGDGRLSRGASSARFKDDITPVDPLTLGDIFPQLHSFVMKDDPNRAVRLGYIAEQMAADPLTEPFVAYEREPIFEQLEVLDADGNVVGHQQGAVIGSKLVRDEDGKPIPFGIDPIALLLAQVAQLHARVADLEARIGGGHDDS